MRRFMRQLYNVLSPHSIWPSSAGTAALICAVAILAVTNFESLSNRSTQQNNIRKLRRDQNGQKKREISHSAKRACGLCRARGVHYFYLLCVRKRTESILFSLVSIHFLIDSMARWNCARQSSENTHDIEFSVFFATNRKLYRMGATLYDVECDSSLIIFEFEEFKVNC